jgi:hypothetical protein
LWPVKNPQRLPTTIITAAIAIKPMTESAIGHTRR